MTIYTIDEYNKMMKSMRDEIKSGKPSNWKPVNLDGGECGAFLRNADV